MVCWCLVMSINVFVTMLDTIRMSPVATISSSSEKPDADRTLVSMTLKLRRFERDHGRFGTHRASHRRTHRHRDRQLFDPGRGARNLPRSLVEPEVRWSRAAS